MSKIPGAVPTSAVSVSSSSAGATTVSSSKAKSTAKVVEETEEEEEDEEDEDDFNSALAGHGGVQSASDTDDLPTSTAKTTKAVLKGTMQSSATGRLNDEEEEMEEDVGAATKVDTSVMTSIALMVCIGLASMFFAI